MSEPNPTYSYVNLLLICIPAEIPAGVIGEMASHQLVVVKDVFRRFSRRIWVLW
jgi:hypothetical protein